ncbi:LysE family transporter [Candidatus Peregrinibacteria bacterium]|nr:LysE family transporter [Candidatus Peregrinibacteria bacterium]
MSAFLTVAVIHLLAVMSPGPDFAIITKQSLTRSRRSAIYTAAGLGFGIMVHVLYSLLGIGLVISQSIVLFNTIKYIGAAYLIYIGWKALTAKAPVHASEDSPHRTSDITAWQSLRMGFLCNVLNPKASLFFLALFTQVIAPETPLGIQLFYGVYMSLATFVWFSFVASVFSLSAIRRFFKRIQLGLERTMGAILILLGLKVALTGRN